jgi:hypothetical protein
MTIRSQNTTAVEVATAYDAIVALGDSGTLAAHAARMRKDFHRRTGAFGPEDAWFETRSRAFWDDALTVQGFAGLAREEAGDELDASAHAIAARLGRAHRGFFVVDEVDEHGASLLDVWSGAELLVRHLDETQALAMAHAEGPMDARVAASPSGADLWVLPGAYHHTADALGPAVDVLRAAAERGMSTGDALDALMRMDLVFRSSSRVKVGFAYRPAHLVPPPAPSSAAV